MDRRRNAVRAKDHDAAFWNLVGFVNKNRAAGFELGHDVDVVHNLFAHVDRGAMGLERLDHRLDSAVDARAVTAGLGKQDSARSHPNIVCDRE